jgi:2-aminobenzoate-CoA ligase
MTSTNTAHVDTFTRDHLPAPETWPDLLFTLPELRYPTVLNAAVELLDRSPARVGPDRICLRSDAATWTYREVGERVDRIARVLVEDLGVVPGSRVLLRGPNNPWLVACWLAVLKAGAVAVTTMPLLRTGELQPIVDAAEVDLALCDHRWQDELSRVRGPLQIVPFGGEDERDLTRLANTKPPGFAAVLTAADDICLIAFTSGTTGQPKGCMHCHRDVVAVADTFSAHLVKPRPDDIFTGSPPLAFTFGLGGLVIFPLRAGASTLLLEQGSPDHLADGIGRHRVTVCSTAPTAYRAMLKLDGADLSSLRRCVSAGEALPRATWEAWRDRTGLGIIDGIGSTEMLHIFVAAADGDIRPGSTGRPVPGYEAAVLDPDGKPLPAGVVGRLAVRGPTGCRYLSGDRQEVYVQHGWNVTGDAYLADEDGYFWYQARTDDMIISSGYNIAGPEVEAALLAHADVLEAGVVGAPDSERGTVVKAFIVLAPGIDPSPDTVLRLQDHVKQTIAPFKYPRSIEFVAELPKTATGKLQRYRLRQLG